MVNTMRGGRRRTSGLGLPYGIWKGRGGGSAQENDAIIKMDQAKIVIRELVW